MAMLIGVLSYFIVRAATPASLRPQVIDAVQLVQPILIGAMLFVAFSKLRLSALRPRRWHAWGLIFQLSVAFAACFAIKGFAPGSTAAFVLESVMLTVLCPTATAAVVVAGKLGARTESLAAYTVYSTLLSAASVPLLSSMLGADATQGFATTFLTVSLKVYPLLLIPLLLSQALRIVCPRAVEYLAHRQHIAFQLWIVALTLAIATTARSLYHSTTPLSLQIIIAFATLSMCILQFRVGRKIGHSSQQPICASQALGQKNTVLLIWLSCTFFSPEVATAGGFYSIWHNLYNSWQLGKAQYKKQ